MPHSNEDVLAGRVDAATYEQLAAARRDEMRARLKAAGIEECPPPRTWGAWTAEAEHVEPFIVEKKS